MTTHEIAQNSNSELAHLDFPEHLLGEDGIYREHSKIKVIKANNDLQAIQLWLNECKSESTRRAYKKEVERLLLWAYRVPKKPLSSLTRDDYRDYEKFMLNPQPASEWIGKRARRDSPEWRPFVKKMEANTARQAIIIIQALLQYLVDMNYLSSSPLVRMRMPKAKTKTKKFAFSESEWSMLLQTIEGMPDKTRRQSFKKARLRWILALFSHTGLRIEEAASHTMADFSTKVIKNNVYWFFDVTGKGSKEAEIPAVPQLIDELKRFRQVMGWSPLLPSSSRIEADRPLVPTSSGRIITDRAIYDILIELYHQASERFFPEWAVTEDQRNEVITNFSQEDARTYDNFLNATPHTIRHTAITWMGNSADLKIQQKFARHSDIRTTINNYDHRQDEELIKSMEAFADNMPSGTN